MKAIPMTDSTKIQISSDVPIARITLHRPEKLNALDPEMLTALETVSESAEHVRIFAS